MQVDCLDTVKAHRQHLPFYTAQCST